MKVTQVNKVPSIKRYAPDLRVKIDRQEFDKVYVKWPYFFKYRRQYVASDAKENFHKSRGIGIDIVDNDRSLTHSEGEA